MDFFFTSFIQITTLLLIRVCLGWVICYAFNTWFFRVIIFASNLKSFFMIKMHIFY